MYGTLPYYPFEEDFSTAVLRHADNRKWYALIIRVSRRKFGFDSDAVLGELQDAIHKLSGVDIRDANGPIVKLLESASREYKEAANYLVSLNLPAGDASSALIARLQ